jgi:hypothetical protein
MSIVNTLQGMQQKIIRQLSNLSEGVHYVTPDELGEAQHKRKILHQFPRDPDFLRDKIHTLSESDPLRQGFLFQTAQG